MIHKGNAEYKISQQKTYKADYKSFSRYGKKWVTKINAKTEMHNYIAQRLCMP